MKIQPVDFGERRRSPCERDRFLTSERRSPAKVEDMENSTASPFKMARARMKLRRRPVVIGKVFDAPFVVNDFPVKLVDFSSRNQLAVALGKSIYIWDDGKVRLLTESDSIITGLCWADAGLVISARGHVELWDAIRSEMTQALAPHTGRCGAMAFRGSRLATGGSDGLVKVTDLRTPTATTVWGHHSEVSVLSWSPNYANIASGGRDGRVIIGGDDKRRNIDLPGSIRGLHYMTPSFLAASTMDPEGTITILHGRQPHEPSSVATGSPISGIAFADRWGLLVAHHQASCDWEIWSPELKRIGSYSGHAADIINIAVSTDASLAITISADETLRIWDLRDKKARTRAAVEGARSQPTATSGGSHLRAAPCGIATCHGRGEVLIDRYKSGLSKSDNRAESK